MNDGYVFWKCGREIEGLLDKVEKQLVSEIGCGQERKEFFVVSGGFVEIACQ